MCKCILIVFIDEATILTFSDYADTINKDCDHGDTPQQND